MRLRNNRRIAAWMGGDDSGALCLHAEYYIHTPVHAGGGMDSHSLAAGSRARALGVV